MKTLVLGPTFLIPLSSPAGDACERLASWLASDACGYVGEAAGTHFQIAEKPERRHRWSPWLTLDVRETEAGAEAFGRFNPSPAIWTGYMLTSLALLTIGFGAAMWGVAEMLVREPPRALLVIPVCLVALVVMWAVSATGQRLARGEMDAMREAVQGVLRSD